MSTLTTHTEMLKLFNYDLQNFASPSASKALHSKITVKKLAESEMNLSPDQSIPAKFVLYKKRD